METLVQQFIKAFGWSIVNSLWQSALIYGVLFIVLLSLPKLAAKYKHNLAFGAIILMFGFFVYNFVSHIVKNMPNQKVLDNAQNLEVYQYFNNLPQSFSSKAEQYFPIIITFYLIGIALQLFVIVKGYGKLSELKKDSLSATPDTWKIIFENVMANLKINKSIKFHLSAIVNVPLVIGYLKPVVLFPIALINQLENDQVEAILIHELSHVRRNDFLLNLIKTAIETFLFYNPFVWMAGKFIHIEREHACDDLVLKITGKPLNYAHALLKLELLKDKTSPAYALAATGKSQNLYQRIKRITNMKTNYLNAKQQMAALTLGVACLFSIAWINPIEKKNTEKKEIKHNSLQFTAITDNGKTVVFMDTTKRRKIKIVTIDANGKKTEYNSVKEMPDSLRKDFYKDELFAGKRSFIYKSDSAFRFSDSLLNKKMYKEFNSPEAQAKWKKFGEDVAKEYTSPEAQAKWKKFGEDVAKEYSSPEAQAKWKKFGEDVAKEYNTVYDNDNYKQDLAKLSRLNEKLASPQIQQKMAYLKENRSELVKKMSDPNFRSKMSDLQKIYDEHMSTSSTPGFKQKLKEVMAKRDLSELKELHKAYILPAGTYIDKDAIITFEPIKVIVDGKSYLTENDQNGKLKQSKEYQRLKQKFDTEVKELKEKMEKQEKKEKPERPEKLEQ